MKWYIIHTTPGRENKVKEQILKRVDEAHMHKSFGEILIPTEDVAELKNGQKKIVQRRLYSGYVFLQMDFSDDAWHLVRKTPNVTGFIGGQARPSPMKDSEVAEIMQKMEQTQNKPAPKIMFAPNEALRIIEGPFKDFNASVHSVDYDKGKLKVDVTVFGRQTAIELAFSDVQKI